MRLQPYNIFLHRGSFENNHEYDYSQYRYSVLNRSFCGKNIPQKIYSSNGRNAVTHLASLGVTCVCCGKKMIDPALISKMDSEGLFKTSGNNILKTLKQFKDIMKPLEKRVYCLLCNLQKQYPDKSLSKLLETQKHNLEAKLIDKQSKIFGKIYDYSIKHLPDKKVNELSEILQNTYNEIYSTNPKTTFGRKKFIGLIYKFTLDISPQHAKKLLSIAEKLPSSKDQYEAFIVKYSRKSNREIALRLIERSVGTIEHIKPRAEGGEDSVYNYALECAEDNWNRGCKPMIEQIQKNPKMPQNTQKQINQIINFVNNGQSKLNSTYVKRIKEAFYRASGGIINLDISKLRTDIPPKEIY